MKFTIEITIDLPRAEVINKLNNIENKKHWLRGLVSAEHLSGTPTEVGSKIKLNYQFGRRKIELTETILKSNFPEEFHGTYDTNGMHNIQKNYFTETPEGKTKWVSESEFIPTGFMMRMMTLLMPRMFKKQSQKYLDDFKNFAEKGISIACNK